MRILLISSAERRRVATACLLLLGVSLGLAWSLPVSSALAQGRDISFIRDTEIENTIRFYMRPIYEAAGVDASTVRIHLIRDNSLNAFVAGGQRIFLHTGLLMQADRPEQVIGVLAHELGHITGGHLSQFRQNLENAEALSIAGLLLGLGAAVATGDAGAGVAGAALGQQLGERSFLQYTRANEQAADQAAVTFLDDAGISSVGLLEFMRVLQEQEKLYSAGANPYTRTHPLSQDRVIFLENHVAASAVSGNVLPFDYQLVHARMRAKLIGYLMPEETLRRFPASDTSPPARYARSIAYMELYQMDEAVAEIDALLAESPADPFFLETRGDILRRAGRLQDAAAEYRRVIEILPWAALIRASLAQVLLESSDPAVVQEALDNASVAVRYEPHNIRAWNLKGQAHQVLGETGMVLLTQAEVALQSNRKEQAKSLAQRAMAALPEGSSGWVQAQDIAFRAEQ
jgi:predicted Zn-dependent protease